MLEGITRRTVLEIAAAELGLPVLERSVDRSELYMADEVFECGTGAQITPVREVDDRAVGDGVRDTPERRPLLLSCRHGCRLTTWTWLTLRVILSMFLQDGAGAITLQLQELFFGMVRGATPTAHSAEWLTPVYASGKARRVVRLSHFSKGQS